MNLHSFALPNPKNKLSKPVIGKKLPTELFLKGPISMGWIQKAMILPGRSFHVSIELCFWAGINKSEEFKFNPIKMQRNRGLNRHTIYRALNNLERAGLISIKRHRGRAPIIKLVSHQPNYLNKSSLRNVRSNNE